MVAPHLQDVDPLNQLARDVLQRHGQLPLREVDIGGRGFAVGDEVLALRNDFRIGILNGTRALVRSIDQRRQTISIETDQGTVSIPFDYAAGWLTMGTPPPSTRPRRQLSTGR
jgi:ATP-dependent exoDNAse (exonuclease V) alpha subunit